MKNKRIARLCLISLIMMLLLTVPKTVYAGETDLTEDIISEVRSRIDLALRAGEPSADLADMNIVVNMYSDKFGVQYRKILDLCRDCAKESGCFILGSHKEPFVDISPETEPDDG